MPDVEKFRLSLPTRADSISLARLFIATVLRSHDVDESLVGDAKLAVSELSSVLIVDAALPEFHIAVNVDIETITVEITPFDPAPKPENTERIDIATALFPSASIGRAGATFTIDMAAAP